MIHWFFQISTRELLLIFMFIWMQGDYNLLNVFLRLKLLKIRLNMSLTSMLNFKLLS